MHCQRETWRLPETSGPFERGRPLLKNSYVRLDLVGWEIDKDDFRDVILSEPE